MRIAQYKNLISVSSEDNGEQFTIVNAYDPAILFGHFDYSCSTGDMANYFDGNIVVRKSVAQKLALANKFLVKFNSNLRLFVTYGYRLLEIQTSRFNNEFKRCDASLDIDTRKEITHKKIAVPEVAGHPTGGAVDVTIFNFLENTFSDMGCKISDFSKDADEKRSTFSTAVNKTQRKNRFLLHKILVRQGFCPYYEEWWHFSYGDKEWAWFYGKDNAIYEQKNKDEIKVIF